MGYMGFGMQKWVYTKRSRRPFSMQKKGSFTKVSTYNREFKLQHSKRSNDYIFAIIILLFLAGIAISKIPDWKIYESELNNSKLEYQKIKDASTFRFLKTSGQNRFANNNIEGAYSEFKLAKAINANDTEVNKLLEESLTILCLNHGQYCDELDDL